MFVLEIILKSFKDIFDKKIFFTSLLPIILASLFWGVIFFIFIDPISHFVAYLASYIPFIGDSSWLQDGIKSIGGVLVYYELVIISSVMIVGIISDKIVDRINEKYYHNQKWGFGSVSGSVMVALRQNLIFITLFLFLVWTLFIPGVNVIIHIFLWSVLIKKPNFYDSLAMYATKSEYKILQKSDRLKTTLLSMIGASMFLIPIVGVFIYVVQLLIFSHFNLKRLKILREKDDQ
jgi:uncharacterized protein involved in cysteine biosynthesis